MNPKGISPEFLVQQGRQGKDPEGVPQDKNPLILFIDCPERRRFFFL